MSTTDDRIAMRDELRANLAELGSTATPTMERVAITPQQKDLWNITRMSFLNQAPAFAHVLYTMMSYEDDQVLFTKDVPIAATDGKRVIINPDTFFTMELGERVFVLAHEVMHAIWEHTLQGYRYGKAKKISYPDGKSLDYNHRLANISMDFIINDTLIEAKIGKKPNAGLHDNAIGDGDSRWIDVYRKLYNMAKNAGALPPPCTGGAGGSSGKLKIPGVDGKSFDELKDPGSADGDNADEAAMQREGSAADWRQAVAAGIQTAKLQGKLPANLERRLGELLTPKVTWSEHIRSLFARKVGSGGNDWRRPERRLISRPFLPHTELMPSCEAVFAPGRSGNGCNTVVVAVDTSGSIGPKILDQFFGEMSGIIDDVRPRRIVVMWCDAKVHRVDEVEEASDLTNLRSKGAPGGGGTAFEPVFKEVSKMGLEPDALVYLTDGLGSFPKHAPTYPVIWGSIYPQSKYPFGDVVHVEV